MLPVDGSEVWKRIGMMPVVMKIMKRRHYISHYNHHQELRALWPVMYPVWHATV